MDQLRQRRHRFVEPVALAAQRPQHHVEVVDDLARSEDPRSASVLVTAAAWFRNDPIGGALSLKRLDQLSGQLVDLIPGSAHRNSGRKPPISASRSNAGSVRSTGIVSPGLSVVVPPAPSIQRQEAAADQIVVADHRLDSVSEDDRNRRRRTRPAPSRPG